MIQDNNITDTYPRLIADIGGTNARFTLEHKPHQFSDTVVLPCSEYDTLLSALTHYSEQAAITIPAHIAIAIANPVKGDTIRMTNHHWQFSIRELKNQLHAKTLLVLNDFSAQALAITHMDSQYVTAIGNKQNSNDKNLPMAVPMAVVGPGTGLGVSGLIPDGRGGYIPLAGEGGHASFAPTNETEHDLLIFAQRHFNGHVSAERILQGEGLVLIYRFLAEQKNMPRTKNTPAEITYGALHHKDSLCLEVLSMYCDILGSFCANVVLTIGATGGLFIGGGIVPRFVDFLLASDFRKSFENKGRFADYLQSIPCYVITHPNPGLVGAATALEQVIDIKKI